MTATATKRTVATGSRVVTPEVTLPPGSQFSTWSAEDQAMAQRLCGEPFEFVQHELFARPNAEELIFSKPAALARTATAFDSDASSEPTRDPDATLTTAQEILLFQQLNYARMRMARLLESKRGQALSVTELRYLLAWAKRAEAARDVIVQSNMPLVLAMGKRTRLSGLDFNEMVSEGNFALLRSVDKFDCSRGFKFSTYACRAILKSFSRVAMRTSRYRCRFPTEFDPTLERSDYVDRKHDDQESSCVDEIREILTSNRADLNDVEQVVIRERFALDATSLPAKGKTLEQVGEMIGVTKERVRQIQNKALAKIKHILQDNYLAA